MNTSTSRVLDYQTINWVTLTPSEILDCATDEYKKIRKNIKNLEKIQNYESDEVFLSTIDDYSHKLTQYINLLSFLKNSGKQEYQKYDDKIRQMQIKIHYLIFANKKIYQNLLKIDITNLDEEDKYFIEITKKTFKFSGVELSTINRKKLLQNDKELSKYQTKYQNNCIKAADELILRISRQEYIDFFMGSNVKQFKANGELEYKDINLNETNFTEIMLNCRSEEIRKKAVNIYYNAATKGKYNNTKIALKILELEKLAPKLLGYKNPNDFILNERVLNKSSKVKKFLLNLHKKIKPIATEELKLLEKEKKSEIFSYDADFYEKKYKEKKSSLNFQDVSKYFPFFKVFNYLLNLNKELFDLEFTPCEAKPPHPEMLVYNVYDLKTKTNLGIVFFDILWRDHKEVGAWAAELHYSKETKQRVVSFNTNFDTENGSRNLNDILLDVSDIKTLFHEMGHAIHFICPKIKYHSHSSETIEWDFIELPSQLYEKWVEDENVLYSMSGHYKTNQKMDKSDIKKLLDSEKDFQALNYQFLISKSILDIKLHESKKIKDIAKLEYNVLKKYQPIAPLKNVSRMMSFSHFFGGGYDVGYYSYVYANVLDSNVWDQFLKNGIMDKKTAMNFRSKVLEVGGKSPAAHQIKQLIGTVSLEPFLENFKR